MLSVVDESNEKKPHKYTQISIEEDASLISKICFFWTDSIIKYGNKKLMN